MNRTHGSSLGSEAITIIRRLRDYDSSRLDLANFGAGFFAGYQCVNRLFAHKLAELLRPDDVIWVHDYRLIPLVDELRALGCKQRIGFFLHIPLPPHPYLRRFRVTNG